MATRKNQYGLYVGLIVVLGLIAFGEALGQAITRTTTGKTVVKQKPDVAPTFRQRPVLVFGSEAALRGAVYDSAARFVGLTERTNNNDATWIAIINRANGLPDRAYYCASSFNYVHTLNGIRLPVGDAVGMVRSYFSQSKYITYRRNQRGNQRTGLKPRRMDAVSLFASHIEAIAQDDFDPSEDDRVKCIGFNTTGGKGTKGGCYINVRRTSEIKLIANFLTPYWTKLHPNG